MKEAPKSISNTDETNPNHAETTIKTIRSIFRAVKVPDAPSEYDTIFARITYPAVYRGTPEERNTGLLSADPTRAPFPIIIFMPGINVGKESYQWLATAFAESGLVTVTFDWIAQIMPGLVGMTAGVDLTCLGPDSYGTRPSGTAIQPLLDMLNALQNEDGGVLRGALDLNSVILGGHSAGATMAFQNFNSAWFPQVKGSFGYGGHTMAATMFGHDIGTLLPILSELPVLVMGGTEDGVIKNSSHRYGLPNDSATAALVHTFDEAVKHGHLAILNGASHFLIAHPHDETTGRGFLETKKVEGNQEMRKLFAEIVICFVETRILGCGSAEKLELFGQDPRVVQWSKR